MSQVKVHITFPGHLADAIYSNAECFSECRDLLELSRKSMQLAPRLGIRRAWTVSEIEEAVSAINRVLENRVKYPSQSGLEYGRFVDFRDHIRNEAIRQCS